MKFFQDFIGQERAVARLERQLQGAMALGEPFPPTCFQGLSGVGKTRLAELLAREFGTNLIKAMGYWKVWRLISALSRLKVGDFLFVDEAHAMHPLLQEVLFKAIDELKVSPPETYGRGGAGSAEEMDIQPFSLLIATDQPGKLSNALLKRMGRPVVLELYSVDELEEIAYWKAKEINVLISPGAARHIARIAGGLPREVGHHLQNLRRRLAHSEDDEIGLAHVQEYFADEGIDEDGLGILERKYLQFLAEMGSASIQAIAMQLDVDTKYAERQIEPYLRRRRWVTVGHGGRKLTPAGRERIEGRE